MRSRRLIWILFGLLCLAGVCLLWQGRDGWPSRPAEVPPPTAVAPAVRPYPGVASGHSISTNAAQISLADWNTNKFAGRLSNTARSLDQLMRDDKAILLENALIDTRTPLNFVFPKNLQSQGDPGAYIVQANGPIDNAFRAMLKASGATIVSYIPNNAYLVSIPANGASAIASNGFPVIPHEPYYKISSSMPVTVGQKTFSSAPMKTHRAAGPSLLALAVNQKPLPAGTCLTLGLFSDNAAATIQQIEKLGGQVFAQDRSPFGPIVRVQPPQNWTALAQLPGVQRVEPYHKRLHANDLSRAAVGVSTDTLVSSNYMNLTGSNVIVEVNDSGIDAAHPDLTNRVFGDLFDTNLTGRAGWDLVDTNGHGTHVAGIIAGDGTESKTVTNAPGSIIATMPGPTATNFQFRGKAPLATLYSVAALGNNGGKVVSDQVLQEIPALTNALISNNSWNNDGDSSYDLAAASYDAAVRDALPEVTGSQPVLFVFSAGNSGGGDNGGFSGNPDTILSPATAKNVITVGALEQLRNITNVVTNLDGSVSTPWQPMTDTGYQVASYSSRGNVGVGIEGTYGRFKPDVVAPGTFVVSTRSEQWDTNAYYNPTNVTTLDYSDQVVDTNAPNYYALDLSTTPNAVGVTIRIVTNILSPNPLNLPIYVSSAPDPSLNFPDPANDTNDTGPGAYFVETNLVTIPPDGVGTYLSDAVASGGFNYAVGDSGTQPIIYDLIQEVFTTNDLGNYYQVLEGLNDSLGTSPEYYRYETGTSMAAADVSGVLALMQDFFTNQWQTLPSPALLKAMLINGARPTGYYDFQVDNSINFQGWGLINLPSALQPGITNQFGFGQSCSTFILDQNPTNALATGDSQTFTVSISTNALAQPLRITLAWTDPPGDPAAAIKLVNNLVLVVTNYTAGFSNPTNLIVYYGNDIPAESIYNTPEVTNTPPVFDSINNVENVHLPMGTGTNFSVTVMGYRVNVNAVTAQTNNFAGNYAPNVVQDYALVISSGDGLITNAMTVTTNSSSFVSNPTSDQQITYVSGNSGALMNQFVGASTPLMGTNTLLLTNLNIVNGETNLQITIGMTNQWHFYVVTNTTGFTNAAFVTYNPDTLSIPRMGVFADSQANATRPEADIDLYITTDSNLLTLNPTSVYNAATNYLASLNNGTNSTPNTFATAGGIYEMASLGRGGTEYVVDTNSQPNEVYYIGVKSEDQMASEYGFIPLFSATPFSQMTNGNEIVTGVGVPVAIPDGNPAVPGYADVFGIAIYPIQARCVVVSNTFDAQDFSDLVGAVNHNGTSVILNNHDSPNAPGIYTFIYDDSGQGNILNSQPSDGPGSLNSFIGQDGTGVWILHEADNAVGFSNAVENFNLTIQPHVSNHGTIIETIPGCSWDPNYPDWIDVPPGATNLTITVTNLTGSPEYPGTLQTVDLYVKFGSPPTLTTYNKKVTVSPGTPATNSFFIGPPLTSGRYFFGVFNPCGNVDQTVSITATYSGPASEQVDFSSTGAKQILDDAVTYSTIDVPDNATIASVDVGLRVDHPRISDLVFHLISPDGTRVLLMENRGGTDTNGCGATVVDTNNTPSTTNYLYLTFTEDTNLTTTPIKFAPPPFVPNTMTINVFTDSFETYTDGFYSAVTNFGGWTVLTNQIAITNYPTAFDGANLLSLMSGAVSNTLPTLPGQVYDLSFEFATNTGGATDNWQAVNITFTASQNGMPLVLDASGSGFAVNSVVTNAFNTNVVFDDFSLTELPGNLYYLPEQSLDAFTGESAYGTWTLEIQDDRAGAGLTNTLVSWQLRFTYATASGTLNGVPPQTNNIIPAGDIVYYLIRVPPIAGFPMPANSATNMLFSASAPLNLWFNETTPPSGSGSPGDYLLLGGVTNGVSTLTTNSMPTNIVDGGSYWLAVQNTNSFAVTYGIEVDFDVSGGSFHGSHSSFSISGANIKSSGAQLQWAAPSDAEFQVEWATNFSEPMVWMTNADIITSSNGTFMFTDPGSTNSPMRFYRLLQLP
jgi:subtilisin-like proprotein convertase family protein